MIVVNSNIKNDKFDFSVLDNSKGLHSALDLEGTKVRLSEIKFYGKKGILAFLYEFMRLDYRKKQKQLLIAEEREIIERHKANLVKSNPNALSSSKTLNSSLDTSLEHILPNHAIGSSMYGSRPTIKFSITNCFQFLIYSGLHYVRNENGNMKAVEDFIKGYDYVVNGIAHYSHFPMNLFKEVANELETTELIHFLENPCGPLTNSLFLILHNKVSRSKSAFNTLNLKLSKSTDDFVLIDKKDILDVSHIEETKESKFKVAYIESAPYINNSVNVSRLIISDPKKGVCMLLKELVEMLKSYKIKDKSVFSKVGKSELFLKFEAKVAILRVIFLVLL